MEREIEKRLVKDLEEKIVLLSGPRQAGKTFLARQLPLSSDYLNFDSMKDRKAIITGQWDRSKELVVFDELHKMKKWKSWIKGIYDTEGVRPRLLVTGSARLETYRKAGDSLAGRFFSFRLHPFTVKEVSNQMDSQEALTRILRFGGFPEPFIKNDDEFTKRWRRTHLDLILREDLLDLEKVRDIKSMELLVEMLRERVGSTINYASLAADLQISDHTVKHWLQILESLYVIFPVRPFTKNIARSILKDSKYYFFDTGAVEGDEGARIENAVASALLRELNFHEDMTGSKVALHFIRDKEKREIDFLTLVDGKVRHLIEVKAADGVFSKNLFRFKNQFPASQALQVVHNLDRKKSTPELQMISAHEFLAHLHF